MLKSFSREIEVAHKAIDLLIVFSSWWISYFFRFKTVIPGAQSGLELWYLKASAVLVALSYYYFRREGLYNSKRLESLFKEVVSVAKANTISFIVFVLFLYFLSPNKASRLLLLNHFLLSSVLVLSFKVSLRNTLRYLRSNGKNMRYALLVGSSVQTQEYATKVHRYSEAGIKIIGWADSDGVCSELGYACYPDFSDELLSSLSPDMVIVGYKNRDAEKVENATKILVNSLVESVLLPDLSSSFVGYSVSDFYGIPTIIINEPNIKSRSRILKRIFDIIFSGLGIILLSPFFVLIAALIKLGSKGPIFYSQIRMGVDGKEFRMFKFRSMSNDKAVNNEGWTQKDDPRVTKLGAFLRKTSLDEFPQLLNVFWSNMSLVGPRPERPQYVHKFREEIPAYMLRHKVKAGMTGWAQINGWRGDTSIENRIECDLYYIKNWSLWMDLTIIVMTFWKGFVNKNAY